MKMAMSKLLFSLVFIYCVSSLSEDVSCENAEIPADLSSESSLSSFFQFFKKSNEKNIFNENTQQACRSFI
jgi:hypothetical protein